VKNAHGGIFMDYLFPKSKRGGLLVALAVCGYWSVWTSFGGRMPSDMKSRLSLLARESVAA
jgi:hypothetical protein